MQALQTRSRVGLLSARKATPAVVCKAQLQENKTLGLGLAVASSILLLSAAAPDAAEAARSSGRVGGSSGFKSRKMDAPSSSRRTTVINNTTVAAPVMAPPVMSPFGFGGFSIMPTFVVPIPMFGGLFQFFVLMMVLGVVFSVISSVAGAATRANKSKDDNWGDL